MQKDNTHVNENKLDARSKWSYSIGGIGRDMTYTYISIFLILYIQYTVKLDNLQFLVLSIIVVLCRIWDAVNDPMMGVIIENTKTKWGKFKPWILIGAISNSIVLVLLFSVRLEGWAFVTFFGVAYLLWGMTFTMNDIGYWSMLPSLSKERKERTTLTSLVAIFASVGAFTAGGLVPIFIAKGNAVNAYRNFSIIFSIAFLLCTLLTVFGVSKKHDFTNSIEKDNISLKKMFRVIIQNKQLMWMSLVILLYYLGSALLNALGINFFYFEFGYSGDKIFVFTVIYALGTIISQIAYPLIAKVVSRDNILKYSFLSTMIGYVLFFFVGYIPVLKMDLWVISTFGVLIFAGQGLFYLAVLIMLANTIEYGEYQTGERNESILFSLRSLMAKLSGALQQGVVYVILLVSGILSLTQGIADLETQKGKGLIENKDVVDGANNLINQATWDMKFILRIGMTILPLLLILASYIVIKRKYIIDEATYDKMIKELETRNREK